MRFVNLVGVVGIVGLMGGSVGCATSTHAGADVARTTAAQPATRTYSAEELRTIMQMRDSGAALADVANRVGGTRADVKAAERNEKLRRRAQRAPGKPLGQLLAFW
jgi:hypothetical protein